MKSRLNKFLAFILLPVSLAIVSMFSIESILGVDSGLVSEAHILMYGIIGFIVGLILAGMATRKLSNKNLAILNLICFIGINVFIYSVYQKELKESEIHAGSSSQEQVIKQPANSSGIPDPDVQIEVKLDRSIGIGMSKAVLNVNEPIEFLDMPGGKVKDIVSFKMGSTGPVYDKKPKYMDPEYDKLDYNILYFKTISQEGAFVEVIVDKKNNRSMWISKSDIRFLPWSEFFFMVHSIEPSDWKSNPLRSKPDSNSKLIEGVSDENILKAVIVQSDWIKVGIYDADYQLIGNGWFQWKDESKMLIKYNLLS